MPTTGASNQSRPPSARPDTRHDSGKGRTVTESDILLRGLEVVSQCYSLGIQQQTLREELRSLEEEAQYHARRLGQIREKEKAIADLLADLRLVDEIVESYDFKKNALIQILLQLQAKKRWLPRHALQWVARRLGVPLARVYEVASFYEAFSLVPQGAHTLQVCMGTSCHVRRAPELSATVSAVLGVPPGGTDAKMMFTFKQVNCLGCCALAPVMTLDKQYHSNPSLKELRRILREAEAGTLGEAGGAGTGGGAGGDAGEETEETSESAEARP